MKDLSLAVSETASARAERASERLLSCGLRDSARERERVREMSLCGLQTEVLNEGDQWWSEEFINNGGLKNLSRIYQMPEN